MKTIITLFFIIPVQIISAQQVTCGEIHFVRNIKGQQTGFYTVDNSLPKWQGISYKRMRPYIICTPVAQPSYERAVRCSKAGWGFLGGAVIITALGVFGYDLQVFGFPPDVAQKVPLEICGSALALGSFGFFCAGRICINISVFKHNNNLNKTNTVTQ